MILKDNTNPPPPKSNRRASNGHEAERKMAFYLNRAFGEMDSIHVINDLRLERKGEVAQIDHLVIHKHGLIIIESKSVAGEVHINNHLEFVYAYGRKREGMPSPIQQAKRQGDLLRALLIDNKEGLRKKKLLGIIQGGFQHCPIQTLDAISDKSIIKRPKQPIPELHKADQITDQVNNIIDRHLKGAKITTVDDGDWGIYSFHPEEFDRVSEFLVARHAPLKPAPVSPPPPPTAKPAPPTKPATANKGKPIFLCTHCQSTNLEIMYGRSYYFKCQDCDGNTGIKNICPACGKTMKTKKRKAEFSTICTDCDTADVFFVNPSPSAR